VGSLGSLQGRKGVIHVSDGIPLHPGSEAAATAQRLCGGVASAQGEQGGTDTTGHPDVYDPAHRSLGSGERDMTREWDEVVVRANAGDVIIAAVQAGESNQVRVRTATSETKRGDGMTPQAQVGDLQDTLFLLAEQTGGRAVFHG